MNGHSLVSGSALVWHEGLQTTLGRNSSYAFQLSIWRSCSIKFPNRMVQDAPSGKERRCFRQHKFCWLDLEEVQQLQRLLLLSTLKMSDENEESSSMALVTNCRREGVAVSHLSRRHIVKRAQLLGGRQATQACRPKQIYATQSIVREHKIAAQFFLHKPSQLGGWCI